MEPTRNIDRIHILCQALRRLYQVRGLREEGAIRSRRRDLAKPCQQRWWLRCLKNEALFPCWEKGRGTFLDWVSRNMITRNIMHSAILFINSSVRQRMHCIFFLRQENRDSARSVHFCKDSSQPVSKLESLLVSPMWRSELFPSWCSFPLVRSHCLIWTPDSFSVFCSRRTLGAPLVKEFQTGYSVVLTRPCWGILYITSVNNTVWETSP